MVISHHISTELAAERQRDLRSSSRRGWRFTFKFGRRAAALEPVPPVQAAGGGGPGTATAVGPSVAGARLRVRPASPRAAARTVSDGRAPRCEQAGV
jgi:hypothetical protein